MTRFMDLDDAAVDQLLRGEAPVGREDLAPLAELAATVRQRSTAQAPDIGPALRAQMQQRPSVPPRYVGMVRRRLQLAAVSAAMVLFLLAASQNALPATAQRIVSVAADAVGIDVPRPQGDGDGPPSTAPDPASPPTGSTKTTDPGEATEATVPTRDAEDPEGTSGTEDSTSSKGDPPEQTPGGATPADPGTPGDGEPATPAVPPAHSNGGGNGNNAGGNDTGNNAGGNGNANGRATAPGQAGEHD